MSDAPVSTLELTSSCPGNIQPGAIDDPQASSEGGLEPHQVHAIMNGAHDDDSQWNATSISLVILACCAVIAMLFFGRVLLIPITMSILAAFILNPLVTRLGRWHIPRSLAAILVILTLWLMSAIFFYAIQDDLSEAIKKVPNAAVQLTDALRERADRSVKTFRGVQEAARKIEQVANEAAGAASRTTALQPEPSLFKLRDFLWTGSAGLIALMGYLVIISFLSYFLLCSGAGLKRRFVLSIRGSFSRRKILLRAIEQIATQIQYSLIVMVIMNAVLGLSTTIVFAMLGLNNPIMWGVIVFAVHIIPYVGSVVIAVAAALAAYMQFGTILQAVLPAAAFLVLATLVGNFLLTWMVSKASNIDAAFAFVGLLFWGWIWGVWGLLLGMPLLAIMKVIFDHLGILKPLGKLLEDDQSLPLNIQGRKTGSAQ